MEQAAGDIAREKPDIEADRHPSDAVRAAAQARGCHGLLGIPAADRAGSDLVALLMPCGNRRAALALVLLIIAAAAHSALADVADVPRGHWAYDAVEELARRGLVLGYPDGNFLGDRTLTRYEMASLVHRALQTVAAAAPTAPSSASSASAVDIANVSRLTEEFKVELAVMGADLARARADIASLTARVDLLEAGVEPLQSAAAGNTAAIDDLTGQMRSLRKVNWSGYVQARYQDSQEPAASGQFDIRRARLKLDASVDSRTRLVTQFDMAGSDKDASVALRDAYISYATGIGNRPLLTFGQFKWPFGYEVTQSSSDRETPERADIFRALFPGERDRGIMLSNSSRSALNWSIGLFNGVGIDQRGEPWYSDSYADNNSHKDIVTSLGYSFTDDLHAGISGYFGKAGPSGMIQRRTRLGADVQWKLPRVPLTLKAEYVEGEEPSGSPEAPTLREPYGYYAQAALAAGSRWTAVYKYDLYDDDGLSQYGRRQTHQAGVIHWLTPSNSLRFFYEWKGEAHSSYSNDRATAQWMSEF